MVCADDAGPGRRGSRWIGRRGSAVESVAQVRGCFGAGGARWCSARYRVTGGPGLAAQAARRARRPRDKASCSAGGLGHIHRKPTLQANKRWA
eukprot:scaffold1001_cov334-Prasinococcus_capsulatus_cf.AAC.15